MKPGDLDRVSVENAAWDAFVDRSPQGILYCKSWWLDAVAPGRYKVLTVRSGETIRAGWPITWMTDQDTFNLTMPLLTQKLGVLFAPSDAKYAEDLANQHKLTEALIESLPPGVMLNQSFHEEFKNWLPFYWRGFHQTTRYTYVLGDLRDTEVLWNQMRSSMRNQVRKAQKNLVRIIETEDVEYFYRVNVKTYFRQNMEPPYSLDLVRRIDGACKRNAGRKIFIAEGADGLPHAAIYIVYDQRCAILLLSGGDEELRGSGAGSLLTWEAIRFASTVSKRFDFEGSMMRSIENFYRDFGGQQIPYFRIWGGTSMVETSSLRGLIARALRKSARIIEP